MRAAVGARLAVERTDEAMGAMPGLLVQLACSRTQIQSGLRRSD